MFELLPLSICVVVNVDVEIVNKLEHNDSMA